MDPQYYYVELAAAYIRGKLATGSETPDLAALDIDQLFAAGRDAGLRLHRFKRTAGLPRIRKVLGILRGLAPSRLVDIGSGRGVFLWPLLDALPGVDITAVDRLHHRVADIAAVRAGGVGQLTCARMDVTDLGLADSAVDVVTILEVLEHLPDPGLAARETLRVAGRAVIASVPSKEDDNPQHIHLFDEQSLTALFRHAGATRVNVDYVLNHMVAVVRKD